MGRPKSKAVAIAEYAAVRALLGLFRLLPPKAAFAVTDRLGDVAWWIDRRHREVALDNVSKTLGGTKNDAAHRRLVRRVFRNFMRVGAEFALLPDLIAKRGLDRVIEVDGKENVERALAAGTGVIVFSAHLGNWEAIAAVGAPLGMRLHSVGRTLDNPWLDRYLTRHRGRYALSVIPKNQGLPQIVRALKRGDCVAMLLDQFAGREGLDVPFLGRLASTFRAPAELAVRFGFPLLGGFGVRVDDSPRFRLTFEPPIFPDMSAPREAEVRRLTTAISDLMGKHVLAHPDQWNWLHRRWRTASKSAGAEPAAVSAGAGP